MLYGISILKALCIEMSSLIMCCSMRKGMYIWQILWVIRIISTTTSYADDTQNVASDFKPGKALTSKSGTLAYLAPEVYEGHGYSGGVDWWSLGVLFYECIYNRVGHQYRFSMIGDDAYIPY